jgi:hypothetical protein
VIEHKSLQSRHPEVAANRWICIAVTDTGTGIEESVRSRIFEPFFTTKGFGEGTGLGLAMVYGIVKNHQGFIDVESETDHGMTIRLYLPVLQADTDLGFEELIDAKTPAQTMTHKEATVLVVEEEEPMARLLRNRLQQVKECICKPYSVEEILARLWSVFECSWIGTEGFCSRHIELNGFALILKSARIAVVDPFFCSFERDSDEDFNVAWQEPDTRACFPVGKLTFDRRLYR